MPNSFIKNIKWSSIESIVVLCNSLFVSLLVIRYLGEENFGLISYSISIVSVLLVITGLGVESVLPKLLKEQDSLEALFCSIRTRLSVSFAFVVLLGFFFLTQPSTEKFLIFLISVKLIFSSFYGIQSIFVVRSDLKTISKIKMTASCLSAIFKLCLVYFDKGISWVAFSYALDYIVLAIILVYSFRPGVVNLYSNVMSSSFSSCKSLVLHSYPFLLTGMAVSLMSSVDIFMLYHLTTTEIVGEYAAALKVSEIYKSILMVLVAAAFPVMLNIQEKDSEEFDSFLSALFSIIFIFGLVVFCVMLLGSDSISFLLFGSEFDSTSHLMVIMSIVSILMGYRLITGKVLVLLGLGMFTLSRTLRGLLINIVSNALLIPIYGANGAAYATVISMMYIGLISDLEHKESRKYFLLKVKACWNLNFRELLRFFRIS